MLNALLGGIIGAFVGSILTFIFTIGWDKYKNKLKFNELLLSVLLELNENKDRMNGILENWPANIKKQFEKDNSVSLSEQEVKQFNWSFPKPYITDSWKSLILSGHVNQLSYESLKRAYKAYDHINSINFLGDLSINIFKILVIPNKLDTKTNDNFDQFCRIGTQSLEVAGSKILEEAIAAIKNELPKKLAKNIK